MSPQPVARPAVSASVRGSWFVFGGLLTAAVLALGAVLAWSVVAGTGLNAQTEQSTLASGANPETVRVEGSSAGIELTGTATDTVSGELHLSWYGDWQPAVDANWEDRTWVVDLNCRYVSTLLWFAPGCGIDYAAQFPRTSDLEVRLSSGSAVVENMTGAVDLQTESGTIDARDVAGDLVASAGSGEILSAGLTSDSVGAQTTSGSTFLEFAEPPAQVEAEATSGSIEVLVPRGENYRVLTNSLSGRVNVDVSTDPDAESVIDLRSTSGSITVSYAD